MHEEHKIGAKLCLINTWCFPCQDDAAVFIVKIVKEFNIDTVKVQLLWSYCIGAWERNQHAGVEHKWVENEREWIVQRFIATAKLTHNSQRAIWTSTEGYQVA